MQLYEKISNYNFNNIVYLLLYKKTYYLNIKAY